MNKNTYRIGIGHDTHRLADANSEQCVLRLGGVDVPHSRRLVGVSDADVLVHAVIDAILGALGLGDIGEFFPENDPKNHRRDSIDMLRHVAKLLRESPYRIVNLDAILFAEQPKIAPYKAAMQQSLAGVLEVSPEQIHIKGKTGEGVGIIGREEAISAECVLLLCRVVERMMLHGG